MSRKKAANVLEAAKQHPWQSIIIAALIITSLTLRLHESLSTPLNPGNTDPDHYHKEAMKLVSGEKITSVYWPWGYPYFLAPFYALFGKTFVTAKVINTLLSVLNAVLVYILARKLFNHATGAIAGALMLFDPLLSFYATNVYTETLFITLLTASLLLAMSQKEAPAWWKAGLIGVLTAYNAMMKPWVIVVVAFIIAWWLLQRVDIKQATYWTGITLIGVLITLTPWTLINKANTGAFVPLPINGPLNLYLGNSEHGTLAFTSSWPDEIWAPFEGMDSVEQSRRAQELALNYIFDDFGGFVGRSLQRYITLWSHPNDEWYQRVVPNMGLLLSYLWIVWALALLGLAYSLRSWRLHSMNYLFLLLITAVFSVTLYLARFKVPTLPFQHIYAAAGIILLVNVAKQVVKT